MPPSSEAFRASTASLPRSYEAFRASTASLPRSSEAFRPSTASLPRSSEAFRPSTAALPRSSEAFRPSTRGCLVRPLSPRVRGRECLVGHLSPRVIYSLIDWICTVQIRGPKPPGGVRRALSLPASCMPRLSPCPQNPPAPPAFVQPPLPHPSSHLSLSPPMGPGPLLRPSHCS